MPCDVRAAFWCSNALPTPDVWIRLSLSKYRRIFISRFNSRSTSALFSFYRVSQPRFMHIAVKLPQKNSPLSERVLSLTQTAAQPS